MTLTGSIGRELNLCWGIVMKTDNPDFTAENMNCRFDSHNPVATSCMRPNRESDVYHTVSRPTKRLSRTPTNPNNHGAGQQL